ncbi:hypothetical protein OG912_14540 [Streptomyces sp. NBC_00464]
MAANVWGSRDLAYAALTYGRQIAVQAGDDLRDAHLVSGPPSGALWRR